MPDDKKYKLWSSLNSSGYYTKGYDEFNKQFSTPESQEELYGALNENKYYTKSKEEFTTTFFASAPVAESEQPAINEITEDKGKINQGAFFREQVFKNDASDKGANRVVQNQPPQTYTSKKDIALTEKKYGAESPAVVAQKAANKEIETKNKILEQVGYEPISKVGDLYYTETELGQLEDAKAKIGDAQARLDRMTLSAEPDAELSQLILEGKSKGATVEENRIAAEKDLFAAQSVAERIDVKAKFRNPEQYLAYYDTETMKPVAMPATKQAVMDEIEKFYAENIRGKNDYVTGETSKEFQANSFAELAPDAQRVVQMAFANRYIPKDDFQQYLEDNNLDFDLAIAPNAGNAFLKGFTGTTAAILKGADITKLPASDALNSLYVQFKNGMITESEFTRAYGDLKESILDTNNKYNTLGTFEDGVLKTKTKLPGITPMSEGKSSSSAGETRFTEYTYSKDQVEKWLAKMPTAEEILAGADTPYRYEKGSLGKAADDLEKYAASLKQNPALKDSFWATEVPTALGGSAPFLLTAVASGLTAMPSWLMPAITGGLASASGQYDEAIAAGATPEEASRAYLLGFGAGTTEAIPIERLLNRFGGGIGWTQKLIEAFKQGTEEAIQESFSTIASNVIAKNIYDASRTLGEDLESGASIGFVTGLIMGGGAAVLSRGDATAEDKKMVEKAQANLNAWLSAQEDESSRGGQDNPIVDATQQQPVINEEAPLEQPIAEEEELLAPIEEEPVIEPQQQEEIPEVLPMEEEVVAQEEKPEDLPVSEEIEPNKPVFEEVLWHEGYGSETKGDAVYLESEEASKLSSKEGKPYRVKLYNPYMVEKDGDFDLVKGFIDEFKQNNPESSWHPETTSYVNKKLKELGYDGLVIKKEAIETEKGYEDIDPTYGNEQVVVFDKNNVVAELQEQPADEPEAVKNEAVEKIVEAVGAPKGNVIIGRVEPIEQKEESPKKFVPKERVFEEEGPDNPLLLTTNRGKKVTYKDVEKVDGPDGLQIRDVQQALNIPYNQAARAYKEYNTIKKAKNVKPKEPARPDITKRDQSEILQSEAFIKALAKQARETDAQGRQVKYIDVVVDAKGKIHHIGAIMPEDVAAKVDTGDLKVENIKVVLDKKKLTPEKFIREAQWKNTNRPLNAVEKAQNLIKKYIPKDLDEEIDMFFAQNGKVHPDDFVRLTGFKKGSPEYKASAWAFSKDATRYGEIADQHFKQYHKTDRVGENSLQIATDVMNRLAASSGKGAILQELADKMDDQIFEEENNGMKRDEFDRLMKEQKAHDDAARELHAEEQLLLAAHENQLIEAEQRLMELEETNSEILNEIVDKYTNDKGEVDWDAAMQDAQFAQLIENLPSELLNEINENEESNKRAKATKTSASKESGSEAETIGEKIAALQQEITDLQEQAQSQESRLRKLKKALDEKLKANQLNMFGNNKNHSLFDDSKELQKEYDAEEKALASIQEKMQKLNERVSGMQIVELQKKMEEAGQAKIELETPIMEEKDIRDAAKKLAAQIRKGKIGKPGMFSVQTPASLVWDAALEVVASSIELTGNIAQAISDGVAFIRESDWYKGLSEEKQNEAEAEFIKAFDEDIDMPEQEPEPDDDVNENSRIAVTAEELPVGVTNAYTNAMLKAAGLDPIAKEAKKVNAVLWDSVTNKISRGLIDPREMVEKFANAEQPSITDEQQAVILFDRIRITNEMETLNAQMQAAIAIGNQNEINNIVQRLAQLEVDMELNALANTKAGREWGRLGQFRQRMAARDYSLASMMMKAKNMANGGKLTEGQRRNLEKLAAQIAELQKERLELEKKLLEKDEEIEQRKEKERLQAENRLIKKIQKEVEAGTTPKNKARIGAQIRRFADKIEAGQISKLGGYRASSLFDVAWDTAIKVIASTLRGGAILSDAIEAGLAEIKKSEWYKNLTEDKERFEKDFREHIENEYAAKAEVDIEALNDEFQTYLDELDIAAEAFMLSDLDDSMRSLFNDMVYNRVAAGDKTINEVVDSIYDAIISILPNVEKSQLRDFISGYGRFSKLSKEEIDVEVREIKRQGRLDAALDAVNAGELPKRSGVEKEPPTQDTRQKQAEILRIIKEKNLEATLTDAEIENQWRSSQEAYHRRLQNAIDDLQKEIDTKTKRAKSVKKEFNDQESKDLRDRIEQLKTIRDAIFRTPPKTKEQKATEAAMRSTQRRIDDLNRRIATWQVTPVKKSSNVIETPELKALRDKRDALQEKLDDMAKLLNPPKTPEQKATDAAIKATQKVIDQINVGIANLKNGKTAQGEIYPEKKQPSQTQVDAQLASLRALRDRLKQERENLLPEGIKRQAAYEKYKKMRERRLKSLEEKIANRDFAPKEKKQPPTEDAALLELNKKIRKAEAEVNLEMERIKLANRTAWRKAADLALEIFNLPKALIASVDMSAPLRQGVFLIGKTGSFIKALGEMFKQAFSQKSADDWIDNLHQMDVYHDMKTVYKLYISEPTAHLSAKEENFMSNLLTLFHKIPIYGSLLKGSERAYAGFLNKLRVDVFLNFRDELMRKGISGEELKKELIGYAKFVNNATGRGSLGLLEPAAPALNMTFFSPKLIMSRINTLPVTPIGVAFYTRLPKRARKDAIISLLKFAGIGTATLVLANLAWGGEDDDDKVEIETDPRSSEFGKMRFGDIRYDIWGGYQQVFRTVAQIYSDQKKSNGKIKDLDKNEYGGGENEGDVFRKFFLYKFSPSASLVNGLLLNDGKSVMGEQITLKDEVLNKLIPLYLQDMQEIYQEYGLGTTASAAIPALFGVGVQYYPSKDTKQKFMVPEKK